jgi:DNA modification methylase
MGYTHFSVAFSDRIFSLFVHERIRQAFILNLEEVLVPYSDLTIQRYNHTDEDGRKYKISALRNGNQEKIYAKEGMIPDSIWDIPIVRSLEEKLDYPTQKPEALLERIIKASSSPDSIVLDCFMGSGTTPAVAQKLGRRWIACDVNKGAIQTTMKRLQTRIKEQTGELKNEKLKEKNNLFGDKSFALEGLNLSSVEINQIQEIIKKL